MKIHQAPNVVNLAIAHNGIVYDPDDIVALIKKNSKEDILEKIIKFHLDKEVIENREGHHDGLFVDEFHSGTLSRYLKSELIQEYTNLKNTIKKKDKEGSFLSNLTSIVESLSSSRPRLENKKIYTTHNSQKTDSVRTVDEEIIPTRPISLTTEKIYQAIKRKLEQAEYNVEKGEVKEKRKPQAPQRLTGRNGRS